MKPLCGFCDAHHYVEEPHPAEAVREALAKLRATESFLGGRMSAIEVGRKTFAEVREASVTEPPVTPPLEPEPVTKSVVTKATVTKGRPRMEHPSEEALRRRKYRDQRET